MRYCWILEGDVPDYERLDKFGVNGVYLDARYATKQDIDQITAKGKAAGVYVAWNWPDVPDAPAGLAKWMADRAIPLRGGPSVPRVQFDVETHDMGFVIDLLEAWRKLQPYQATSWTLEGLQGGLMSADFVTRLLKTKTRISPQCYYGSMAGIASDSCLRDLLVRGIPQSSISCFYDAAKVGDLGAWDGFLFHQGRLPS